jgi:hypothetical protein
MPERCHARKSRDDISQQLEALGDQLRAKKGRPRNISAWPCQASDQTILDWIGHRDCNDRNCIGRFFGYACCRRAARNDKVNVGGNQFSGEASEPIQLPVPVSALYGDVLPLRVAKLAHSLLERIQGCGKLIGAG